MNSPCYQCKSRVLPTKDNPTDCHSFCKEYKKYQAELEEMRKHRLKKKYEEDVLTHWGNN